MTMGMSWSIRTEGLGKAFTLHLQGGTRIPVLGGVDLGVAARRMRGALRPLRRRQVDADALPLRQLRRRRGPHPAAPPGRDPRPRRRRCPGWCGRSGARRWAMSAQFLRVIPRVPTLDIVAEPLIARGMPARGGAAAARALLLRLNLPARLHGLPPATFSGGEQQRVNLARGFAPGYPVLLLDEPTASLDAANREVVIGLIEAAKAPAPPSSASSTTPRSATASPTACSRSFPCRPPPDVRDHPDQCHARPARCGRRRHDRASRDGLIAEVQPGRSSLPGAVDCGGDHLIPGVVDVHTDNLERQVQPRANARWPSRSALLAHDAQCAAAGVTTVLRRALPRRPRLRPGPGADLPRGRRRPRPPWCRPGC